MYIYQYKEWPEFRWDSEAILPLISKVRNLQGYILGRMESLGFELRNEAMLETMSLEIIKSTEIEGELLDSDQVRSSVARRLGLDIAGLVPSDRDVDGVVDLMMDATVRYDEALTEERLFGWHSLLFPPGRSGMYAIAVGQWRVDSTGPMQVVSGALGKERVHFQAPDSDTIPGEMACFLSWFNRVDIMEPVVKAAVAHLWFVTLHPFEDGNGRVVRALSDMLLARSDGNCQRFYSMSAQIRKERKAYYMALESTQKGSLDITDWLVWFLECLYRALLAADEVLAKVLQKAQFWKVHAITQFNPRQLTIVNRLLDGFEGKLTTSKWAKIAKCSQDTALRDIQDLIAKNVLQKEPSGGRSTGYVIKP